MGYTTNFDGQFKLNKTLDLETYQFLTKLSTTRRMKRAVDAKYGVEGEFYVDGGGFLAQDREDNILNYNSPPSTQPGLWCHWIPTEDGNYIEWDEGEKFYYYVEWIEYIIEKILIPRGYSLTGEVAWEGEEQGDIGSS
jgi:hypothetical protein